LPLQQQKTTAEPNKKQVVIPTDIFFNNCLVPDGYFLGRNPKARTINSRQRNIQEFRQR
jgi:hypothetical protein